MSAEIFFLCEVFILLHIELHCPGRSHHSLSLNPFTPLVVCTSTRIHLWSKYWSKTESRENCN
jgi:hypothetical protein